MRREALGNLELIETIQQTSDDMSTIAITPTYMPTPCDVRSRLSKVGEQYAVNQAFHPSTGWCIPHISNSKHKDDSSSCHQRPNAPRITYQSTQSKSRERRDQLDGQAYQLVPCAFGLWFTLRLTDVGQVEARAAKGEID